MRNTTPYALVSSLTLVSLMILSCFVSFCIVEEGTQDRQELDQIKIKEERERYESEQEKIR